MQDVAVAARRPARPGQLIGWLAAGRQTEQRRALFMRPLETDPSKLPPWARDISNALASAKEAPPEQRLVMFLVALSAETLRLACAESDESGEAVAYAAICLRELYRPTQALTPSEEELDR